MKQLREGGIVGQTNRSLGADKGLTHNLLAGASGMEGESSAHAECAFLRSRDNSNRPCDLIAPVHTNLDPASITQEGERDSLMLPTCICIPLSSSRQEIDRSQGLQTSVCCSEGVVSNGKRMKKKQKSGTRRSWRNQR